MNTIQIRQTLEQHALWQRGEGGQRANLRGANLRGADLILADLSGANLRGSDLSGADLSGSNLSGANLRGSDLSGADLSGANLRGSDLREAGLSGSNLSEADLYGAKGIMQFGPMPTSGRIIYAVRHDSGWMVQAGCFWGNLDELEADVKEKHNCPMYLGIIQLLRNTTNQ